MANAFSVTAFTSKTLGTFLHQKCPMLATSYRGVQEYTRKGGYAPGNIVEIKIPGQPTVQRGIAVVAEDIIDRTVPYTLTQTDVYNITYAINIQDIELDVVGGELAFTGDPNKDPDDSKKINPQARTMIDNYVFPAGTAIIGDIETELATKAKNAAFYTPIDTPAKLGNVNSFSSISSVTSLMNELGFLGAQRMGVMNNNDATSVSDSLQNMFNETINEKITRELRLGGPDKGRLAGQDIFTSNSLTITTEAPQFAVSPTFTVGSVAADGSTITFAGVDTVTSVLINAGSMISIPTVFLINKVNKKVLETKLVITAAADASGDGAGNVTVTLSEALIVTGMQANVDSLPAVTAAAELFPQHRNNFFYVPMGIIANPVMLGRIVGADNNRYTERNCNIDVTCYVQGLVTNGVNSYRMSTMVPTLAVSSYLINLPSAIPA